MYLVAIQWGNLFLFMVMNFGLLERVNLLFSDKLQYLPPVVCLQQCMFCLFYMQMLYVCSVSTTFCNTPVSVSAN